MKLNKKTSIPLLLALAGSAFFSVTTVNAYQPVETKVPFVFKNFEAEDAKNYSLSIKEKGTTNVSNITYNIANPNKQYYTMSFTQPGTYYYEIIFSAFGEKTMYDLTVEVQTTSENKLVVANYITKEIDGNRKKVELEFEEDDEPTKPSDRPSDRPSDKPSENPSGNPSETPSSNPSDNPSWKPSDTPSIKPSDKPLDNPSDVPSIIPSEIPSENPSDLPSDVPSVKPSEVPSKVPSVVPSDNQSTRPSVIPIPSIESSEEPSNVIVITPSSNPSNGVQTGDNYLPILTIGGIGTMFLTLSVILFKKKK